MKKNQLKKVIGKLIAINLVIAFPLIQNISTVYAIEQNSAGEQSSEEAMSSDSSENLTMSSTDLMGESDNSEESSETSLTEFSNIETEATEETDIQINNLKETNEETNTTQQDTRATTKYSGVNGTSAWQIDSDGVLHIGAGGFNGQYSLLSPWNKYISDIKKIVFEGPVVAHSKSQGLFMRLEFVTEIEGLSYLDTSNVTNSAYMFSDMSRLVSLDLSSFDTSNTTNMGYMFSGSTGLTSLDLSNFDTSKVLYMWQMFKGMSGLTSLDISSFDTGSTNDMTDMFSQTPLEHIKLGSYFQFHDTTDLMEPLSDTTYTGKWQLGHAGQAYTSEELTANYDGSLMSGDWYWEKADQTSIEATDSSLYVGDTWNPESNFNSATDKTGVPLKFEDIIVVGTVDTGTPGVYPVSYVNGSAQSDISITVTEKPVIVPELTLKADAEISYSKGSTIIEAQFLKDIHAELNGNGTILSDFETMVQFDKVGEYNVTLQGIKTRSTTPAVFKVKVKIVEKNNNTEQNTNYPDQMNDNSSQNSGSKKQDVKSLNGDNTNRRFPATGEAQTFHVYGLALFLFGLVFLFFKLKHRESN